MTEMCDGTKPQAAQSQFTPPKKKHFGSQKTSQRVNDYSLHNWNPWIIES